tara:strand:+ start:224 stop:433 length:210 start_codon:yes stop_codon:yes gene_type:complete
MPKGKGYTAKQIQAMRDEGVLSPSEIDNAITRGTLEGIRQRQLLGKASAPLAGTRRSRSQGYKYFPDNP